MDKKELRRAIKALKAQVSDEQKLIEEQLVFSTIEQMDAFKSCNNVLLYCSMPDELPTRITISRWAQLKNIFLPRVNGDVLDIVPLGQDLSNDNRFNIDEPTGEPVDGNIIDLIIVPAIALDPKCNRMGRGKGFYDKLLATVNAYTIGVALECQLVDSVPVEPHDKALDVIVTAHHQYFKN